MAAAAAPASAPTRAAVLATGDRVRRGRSTARPTPATATGLVDDPAARPAAAADAAGASAAAATSSGGAGGAGGVGPSLESRAELAASRALAVREWLAGRPDMLAFDPSRRPTRLAAAAASSLRAWAPHAADSFAAAFASLAAAAVLWWLCSNQGEAALNSWLPSALVAARWHVDCASVLSAAVARWPSALVATHEARLFLTNAVKLTAMLLRDPTALVESAPALGDALFAALTSLAGGTSPPAHKWASVSTTCAAISLLCVELRQSANPRVWKALTTIGFNAANVPRLVALISLPGCTVKAALVNLIIHFPRSNPDLVRAIATTPTLQSLALALRGEDATCLTFTRLMYNLVFTVPQEDSPAIAAALLAAPAAVEAVTRTRVIAEVEDSYTCFCGGSWHHRAVRACRASSRRLRRRVCRPHPRAAGSLAVGPPCLSSVSSSSSAAP